MKARHVHEFFLGLAPAGTRFSPRDGLKVGSLDATVKGMAVTWMATRAVLLEAARQRLNFVISYAPIFHDPDDHFREFENDRAFIEKMQEILANRLLVYRLHDLWLDFPEKGIADSLAAKIGLPSPEVREQALRLYTVPLTTPEELSGQITSKLKADTATMAGTLRKIRRLALICGGAADFPEFRLAIRAGADGVLASEAPEAAIRFAEDSEIAVILIRHPFLEEPGLQALAALLEQKFPNVPVKFLPTPPFARTRASGSGISDSNSGETHDPR